MYVHEHNISTWCPRRPEEGISYPGTGVRDSWDPGAGNRTLVLWVCLVRVFFVFVFGQILALCKNRKHS